MKTSYRNQLEKNYDSRITGKRLNEETLLFLGTGAIAQRAAYLAKAFGMKVIGVSKSGKNVEQFDEVYTIEELDDVIENIIVNALPETEETIYLLKEKISYKWTIMPYL